jgi:hypothetical protein
MTIVKKDRGFSISWFRLAGSLVIGAIAAYLCLSGIEAGHKNLVPAVTLFPWAMLLLGLWNTMPLIGLFIIAIVQWPLYSIYLDCFEERKVLIMGLAFVHIAIVLVFLLLISSF